MAPRSALAATPEPLAKERMEAVLHEAEEALKSAFGDELNQELKALRERHYFRNDEISRARQKNEERQKKNATGTS
jgi:hypothetical protein